MSLSFRFSSIANSGVCVFLPMASGGLRYFWFTFDAPEVLTRTDEGLPR
jgi:hypothetical protein